MASRAELAAVQAELEVRRADLKLHKCLRCDSICVVLQG